ncbi:MAG: hypothetical protein ACKN81_13770, partial [Pirellulaceae bacterium]
MRTLWVHPPQGKRESHPGETSTRQQGIRLDIRLEIRLEIRLGLIGIRFQWSLSRLDQEPKRK